jgi:prepilin-type N-terminal cleavage/methylation domain-containing protein
VLNRDISSRAGMSLVEVMVSLSIASFIAIGSATSAILFAKIANAHENRCEFNMDVRNGLEQLSFDIRNSTKVTSRGDDRFTLTFKNGDDDDVEYRGNETDKKVIRTQGGSSRTIFSNVVKFDVLQSAGDESGSTLTFEDDEISIESIEFERHNGSMADSELKITDFTFKIRNSQ